MVIPAVNNEHGAVLSNIGHICLACPSFLGSRIPDRGSRLRRRWWSLSHWWMRGCPSCTWNGETIVGDLEPSIYQSISESSEHWFSLSPLRVAVKKESFVNKV